MKKTNQLVPVLLVVLTAFTVDGLRAQEHGPLVKWDDQTSSRVKLVTDDRGDRVPDFSYTGYRHGNVSIPDLPVEVTLKPSSDNRDDRKRIQKAINRVADQPRNENGFRGAVLLRSGTYHVSGSLHIRASGVVLRGEGQGPNGTRLIATRRKKHALINVGTGGGRTTVDGSRTSITNERVPVGARQFKVKDASGFEVGDEIEVIRFATQKWIETLNMDRFKPPNHPWDPDGYDIRYKRIIQDIQDDRIQVDVPIVMSIEQRYGGGAIQKFQMPDRIERAGVEHLRLVSEYDKSEGKTDEEHGWKGVVVHAVKDGWVRNVTAQHFGYSAVSIGSRAWRISVLDCANLDPVSKISGGRRYSFAVRGQQNLVMRCYSRGGRHDFVMHARAAGPNAFVDCLAENAKNHTEPHHRWATGVLYDNVLVKGQGTKRALIGVGDRGDWGSGHGWAGAWTVLWNCGAQAFVVQNPPTARNLMVGARPVPAYEPSVDYAYRAFQKRSVPDLQRDGRVIHDGRAQVFSPEQPVRPRSLYLTQLEERRGAAAVKSISTPAQRAGNVEAMARYFMKFKK